MQCPNDTHSGDRVPSRAMPRTLDTVAILEAVLRDHGVSQSVFADEIGVNAATVNRWMNRRTGLTEARLADALHAAGIDPASYGLKPVGLPAHRQRRELEQVDVRSNG